jgi:hypothetical protein
MWGGRPRPPPLTLPWHKTGMYSAFDFASAQAIQRLTLKPHAFFAEPITAPDHG